MRKVKLFFLLTALLAIAQGMWADEMEGPWTRIAYKTGLTDLNATTSSTFNNLNGNSWADIIAWNLDLGIGYTISGGSCVAGTKIGVFSIYELQESLPSYTRKVLTWTYQIGSCNKRHYSNTALYGYYGPSNDLKNLNVDFTYNYSNGAGSGYLAERYFNNTIDQQGHYTNSKTWDIVLDNSNGTSQVTKVWSLLLTNVIGFGANGVTDSFEWACFKSISESWATYYYKYVSFNANGGSGSMSQQTVENSANLKANAFSRTGYTFDGWATSPTGGKAYNNQANITATSSSKGPVTLYARWTANTYTVTFDKQSGTGGSNSVTATYGSAMPSATMPTRTGYTFGGYFTGTGGSGTQYYNANGGSVRNWDKTSNTTLYAKWTANTYKVKFNGNGSTSGSMSDQNFTYGTAQNLTANAFSKTGYTFAGWATSADGAKAYDNQQSVNNLTATNSGTYNLYAVWSVENYTISYTLNGGTATNPANYNIETATFTLNNPTRDGYTFTGWTGSNGSTPQTSVSIANGSTGNKNYTANWISQAAVDVMDLINAIGTPITLDSKDAIDAARAAYNALTDAQKTEVTNYATLTNAEAAYNTLVADHAAADAVIAQINAIGSPITAASQTAIDAARNAYDNLTDNQKALVGNLSTLTNAEAALAVVDLINAIDDPVVYTDACHQEILDAREAYNNLTGDQQALVGNYATLTDAEADYAALNVDFTAKADPVNPGVYYSTFYDGSRQLQLPANVEAYTATVDGDKMLLKKVAVPGDILPAATAVVLRASQDDFTLTPSAASPVSVENNALLGTDVNMTVPSAHHCYVLSGADGFVGFYPLSGSYTLTAHKAYIDLDNLPGGALHAPRRLRFVFSEEQTATGMENVQNEETKAQKVMIDGVMYIIRGEHMYDAQGQVVK